MSGAKSVSDRASSKAEDYSDFEKQQRFFSIRSQNPLSEVVNLYLIWIMEQRNNYQLRLDNFFLMFTVTLTMCLLGLGKKQDGSGLVTESEGSQKLVQRRPY